MNLTILSSVINSTLFHRGKIVPPIEPPCIGGPEKISSTKFFQYGSFKKPHGQTRGGHKMSTLHT